jgi:SAM-dependent methyltransferase
MISLLSEGSVEEGMPEAMLTETLERVRSHPWWKARANLALAVLARQQITPPATVLDVGCGWGVTLDALERAGYSAIGLDISRRILERIDQPNRRLVQADLRRPLTTLGTQSDALFLLDVIEHVDDDQCVLRHCAQLLKPGGLAVVSVPARPDLFSEFDQIQGHRRRYLPDPLAAAFSNTGLELQQIFWWGQWMVPLLSRRHKSPQNGSRGATRTYADYLKLPPWPGPYLMRLAYMWEHGRALKSKLHTGTSLFAVATRGRN